MSDAKPRSIHRRLLSRTVTLAATGTGLAALGHGCHMGRVTTWGVLELVVREPVAEIAAAVLFDLSTTGLEEIATEPETVGVRAYFAGPVPESALPSLVAACGNEAILSFTVSGRSDEDWSENWKLHFRAQSIGKRLYVCPPWDCHSEDDRTAIIIEPGMAFGTGQHATTRGCLVLLEELLGGRQVKTAIDVGTGSGILAIALAKLGVELVYAIDNDPEALRIAAANASANQVDSRIRLALDLDSVPTRCDLIVANLFANLLIELAPALVQLAAPGAAIVLSGILAQDVNAVLDAFATSSWELAQRFDESPWCALQLRGIEA